MGTKELNVTGYNFYVDSEGRVGRYNNDKPMKATVHTPEFEFGNIEMIPLINPKLQLKLVRRKVDHFKIIIKS